jgi:hypothetical protein
VHAWLSGVKHQHSISIPGVSGMCAGPLRVAVLDAVLSCNVNVVTIMENLGHALCESLKGARYERWRHFVLFVHLFHQSFADSFMEQHHRLQIKRFRD